MDYFLARQTPLRRLPPEGLAELSERLRVSKFARGEPVFHEGARPDAAWLLRSGLVKLVKYSPGAEPFTMEIVVPGSLFGMIAVMDDKPYPVSAVPLKDSEAYRIPAALFADLLRRHAEFSREVYAEVGSHLRHAHAMRALAKEPVAKRVAFILCLLHRTMGPELTVRREEIAEMASCTQETAIRVLAAFKKKRLVSSGWKRITILDCARLKALSGHE